MKTARSSECVEQPAPGSWGPDRIDQHHNLNYDDYQNTESTYVYGRNTGSGVQIYVVWGGIYVDHPTYEGKAVNGFIASSFEGNAQPIEYGGHYIASLASSRDFGVAKDANLIGVKVQQDDKLYDDDLLEGLEWVYEDHLERYNRDGVIPKTIVVYP